MADDCKISGIGIIFSDFKYADNKLPKFEIPSDKIDDTTTTAESLIKCITEYLDVESAQNKLERTNDPKSTLYFEDDDEDEKVFCKKRIIFPHNMKLSQFTEDLISHLRGDAIKDGKLILHYVEGM